MWLQHPVRAHCQHWDTAPRTRLLHTVCVQQCLGQTTSHLLRHPLTSWQPVAKRWAELGNQALSGPCAVWAEARHSTTCSGMEHGAPMAPALFSACWPQAIEGSHTTLGLCCTAPTCQAPWALRLCWAGVVCRGEGREMEWGDVAIDKSLSTKPVSKRVIWHRAQSCRWQHKRWRIAGRSIHSPKLETIALSVRAGSCRFGLPPISQQWLRWHQHLVEPCCLASPCSRINFRRDWRRARVQAQPCAEAPLHLLLTSPLSRRGWWAEQGASVREGPAQAPVGRAQPSASCAAVFGNSRWV